ncbi:hypothetical protein KSP39_PZI006033 [Platanthera zijinensis]|uniref:RNase H type-1 domain-containing protein n=1 Tax=Platanthera zijinensis TaxID=2320716 RepID=A0AAP0BRT8_9ASPA
MAIARELRHWGFSFPIIHSWSEFTGSILTASKLDLGPFRIFAYVVYQNWRSRNAKLHGQDFGTPLVLAASIMENIDCASTSPSGRYWGTNRLHRPLSIFWCPPPPEWIKINVDGALLTNNGAGIGLTARDRHGPLVLAAGSGIMHWDPGQVELGALLSLRRFLTPAMLEAKDIIIEGDCKNVIDFCRRTLQRSTWSTPTIMEQELAFLAELNNVMMRHIPREANRLADYCAKYDMYNTFVWTDRMVAPPEFLEILQADLDGMPNV